MLCRTGIGLDVHARSIAAAAFIPETGEIVHKAFPYGARQDGRMMPLRPWAAAWQMGPSRKPAPGSMARGAVRESAMRSLRATRDPRHAELPSRKHRNALPNARISDSQSCVESDTPRRRRASGGRYREWPHPRSGIRGWDHYVS